MPKTSHTKRGDGIALEDGEYLANEPEEDEEPEEAIDVGSGKEDQSDTF